MAFPLVRLEKSNDADIYLMDADGTNLTLFAHSPYVEDLPAFTHDGSRLCYLQARNEPPPKGTIGEFTIINDGNIVCQPITGGKEDRLNNVWLGKRFWFAFLPGDREMLIRTHTYCGLGHDKHEFWVMDPANPADRRLVNPDLVKLVHPERLWSSLCELGSLYFADGTARSRDGRYLVFNLNYGKPGVHWNEPSRDHLFLTDLQTMETRELADNEEGAEVQDISPDGSQILFTTKYGHDMKGPLLSPSNLWIINRDGTGLRNIPLDFSAVMGQGPVNDLEALRQAPPLKQP